MKMVYCCFPKNTKQEYEFSENISSETTMHKSASFSVNTKTSYIYNKKHEGSYKGGYDDIINTICKEPSVIGRTGKLYVTREKDKIFKKLLLPEQYYKEKELINKICTGKCKYILSDCGFFDTLHVISMPNYSMDIHTYIHNNGCLSEMNAMNMCMNVSIGLSYIHIKGYVYGDLKTENVCIKNGNITQPIIIDIGSCHKNRPSITIETASPEALRGCTLDYSHDTWTLGVFFLELATHCFVNPTKVRNEHCDWYYGPTISMNFLRSNKFFEGCTQFDKKSRICNFSYLKNKCSHIP